MERDHYVSTRLHRKVHVVVLLDDRCEELLPGGYGQRSFHNQEGMCSMLRKREV